MQISIFFAIVVVIGEFHIVDPVQIQLAATKVDADGCGSVESCIFIWFYFILKTILRVILQKVRIDSSSPEAFHTRSTHTVLCHESY